MNLIPIAVGPLGDEIQTTDARNLHGFLEVGRIFAAWIQDRIAEYKFVEGRDFVVFSGSGNNPQGGRPSREYAITLEMAKELAMVERTDKGREARQYFIECERKLHMVKQPSELSRLDILKLAMESEERAIKAEADRDHAIATKAQIGSKREATAMATASAAKREVSRLMDRLGFNTRHATVKAVEGATRRSFGPQGWQPLGEWCKSHGISAVSVPDPLYGSVKSWPADAWGEIYGIDLSDLFSERATT